MYYVRQVYKVFNLKIHPQKLIRPIDTMYVVETYMYNFFIKGKMNTNIMQYIQTESFESMIKLLGLGIAENLIRGGGDNPIM